MGDQKLWIQFTIQNCATYWLMGQILLLLHRPLDKAKSKIPAAEKRKLQAFSCVQSVNCHNTVFTQKAAALGDRLRRSDRINKQ